MSIALSHLQSLNNFMFTGLTEDSIIKLNNTVNYSMSANPYQNIDEVTRRCKIAIYAEQKVAQHMNGCVMSSEVDFNDPFTYAFDVLSGPDYYGARIEVKTHQSNTRWISVNLDRENITGHMNLYPFLNYEVADYITIYKSVILQNNTCSFNNIFTGTADDIRNIITRSMYNGWYLNI